LAMNRRTALTLLAALVLAALSLGTARAQQAYTLTDLGPGTPEGGQSCVHINTSGKIVGFTGSQAFQWVPSGPNAATGTYSFLPVPSGTTSSAAYGINASGQIVGARAYTVTAKNHKTSTVNVAVLWQPNGTSVDLTGGQATGINDAGEI